MDEIAGADPCPCAWGRSNAALITRAIGRALHTLQDFYSHTDWLDGIELIPHYDFWGDRGRLEEKAKRHVRRSVLDTLDLNQLRSGNDSQVADLIYFTGGYVNPVIARDDHVKYAADEPGTGRDCGCCTGGVLNAYQRANYAARKQTQEFREWAASVIPTSCRPYLLRDSP